MTYALSITTEGDRTMPVVKRPVEEMPAEPHETFRVRGRKGVVSLVESSYGYYEVWATDGSLGDPQRYWGWDDAVEAFEYGCVGRRLAQK